MNSHRSETWFLVALFALALFISWLILAPYVSALILAGTLAFLFRPWYEKLLKLFRFASLAALAVVILVTVIVFVPLGFFGVRIFGEATALYSSLASHNGFDFGAALAKLFPGVAFSVNVNDYARQ